MRARIAGLALAAALLAGVAATASPALAATAAPAEVTHQTAVTYVYHIPRWHAYLDALSRAGSWYVWGGAGPWVFDCSGLVMWSYEQVGIDLPHNTVAMLDSGRLQWVPASQLKPGDLAFFGTGHVELYTGVWGWTFGAASPGTQVWFHQWNAYWHPTAFYHVIGSG